MINKVPYDETNSSNPWLIERNNHLAIEDDTGNKLTASYIWSKQGQDREKLVEYVFNYYREKGFPYNPLSDQEIRCEYNKLKSKNPDDVIDSQGFIKNSSSLANEVYKSFVWNKYFAVRGNGNSISMIDAFNDDEILLKVIKNRMGYCLTTEDGTERPYIFSITGKMILQGLKSSGFGFSTSLFKPVIAKYLYKHYAKEKVLDFSAGWGARALAAMSLGLEYYGIDPLTSSEINNMMNFLGGKVGVVDGGSEDIDSYKDIPMVDCVMSCPPYYDLEIYSDDDRQSINRYKDYSDWINIYWDQTVQNCLSKLKENGYFIVIAKQSVGRYELCTDLINICINHGLKISDKIFYKTSQSHLSGKKKTGKIEKFNEIACVMKN